MMMSMAERNLSGWRRGRLLAAGVVGLAGAVGCWKLTADLWEPGQSGAERANVLALPVAIVSVVLAAVSIWLTVKSLRPGLDSRQAVRELSQAVRAERQRFLDQALAVAWRARPARVRFTDPPTEILPEQVEALLLRWQDLGGAEAGSIEDVAAFYQNQPTGRLIVLGAPGAGKTVLLSRLILDLLDQIDALPAGDLAAGMRIPVLLSLPACDLGEVQGASSDQLAHRLQAWIITRLCEDYRLRAAHAAALMQAQRILPVLDGLDEMDPVTAATGTVPMERPRAVAVLRALNAGIRAPVVVACRHTHYLDISQAATAPAATPTILTDARHVTLRPLDRDEVIAYLTARFHDQDGQLRSRWQPVADALNNEAPLLGVLANPWQLFLAVTAYTAENSHPADLLAMSPERVETHLLTNLIPAVVEHDETAAHHGWTVQDVTRWLRVIASHQHRTATEHGTSETDIYLPELWRVTGSSHPRWISLILSLIPFIGLILFSFYTGAPGLFLVFELVGLTTIGFKVFDPSSPMKRIDLGGVWTPKGRRRLRTGLAVGLAMGLVGVLGFVLAVGLGGLAFGLTFGLSIGLAYGLAYGLASEVAAVSSASVLARQCLGYAVMVLLAVVLAVVLTFVLAVGLSAGPMFGLAAGLTFGLPIGLPIGLVIGLVIGLAYGNGSVWLRYAIAVRAAARQGSLPRHPARFLDWCLHTGLMRMAGIAIQFRHRRLQEALTPPYTNRADFESRMPPTADPA
jgi:GTPase SAR1 family protein